MTGTETQAAASHMVQVSLGPLAAQDLSTGSGGFDRVLGPNIALWGSRRLLHDALLTEETVDNREL